MEDHAGLDVIWIAILTKSWYVKNFDGKSRIL